MSVTDEELVRLAAQLGRELSLCEKTVTAAESCTGGWIAKVLTDIPGSSAWFGAGFVTYSNESKSRMLSVPTELLETHGAVSEDVVIAMANGALAEARADICVAVSGIAGPDGGTPDKPVGTVHFAWATPAHSRTAHKRFDGDREAVRRQTVAEALKGLLTMLRDEK